MELNIYSEKVKLELCPHILVGGCSGSGKTYLLKSMLCDVLESDEDCRVLVIDPKSVDYQFLRGKVDFVREVRVVDVESSEQKSDNEEQKSGQDKYGMLGKYGSDGSLGNVVKSVKFDTNLWLERGLSLLSRADIESGNVLRWLSNINLEMDRRYNVMMSDGSVSWSGCRIVVLIDELTDLIWWDRSDVAKRAGIKGRVEDLLVRLATMGRAAGIHLVLGTQRPDAGILSGQLRGNLGCRVCLKAINSIERRIILGDSCRDLGEKVLYYGGEYKELVRG